MKTVIIVVGSVTAIASLIFGVGLFGFALGQSDVMRATVVRVGTPYYSGVFFGQCAWTGTPGLGLMQACATDRRYDETGHPL